MSALNYQPRLLGLISLTQTLAGPATVPSLSRTRKRFRILVFPHHSFPSASSSTSHRQHRRTNVWTLLLFIHLLAVACVGIRAHCTFRNKTLAQMAGRGYQPYPGQQHHGAQSHSPYPPASQPGGFAYSPHPSAPSPYQPPGQPPYGQPPYSTDSNLIMVNNLPIVRSLLMAHQHHRVKGNTADRRLRRRH